MKNNEQERGKEGMRFVIVTGMSGAGKSSVLKMLEDCGYFCVDNLPIPIVSTFYQLTLTSSVQMKKVAIGVDIRSGTPLDEIDKVFESLIKQGQKYEILFLDASTEVLVKRYKETRRVHPLAKVGRIDRGIESERKLLNFLKDQADYIIDTSHLLIRELKAEVNKIFVENEEFNNFFVTVVSFGFKYGIPADADLVFDVRFLPNPYYIPKLKMKTGDDKEVFDYVMSSDTAKTFLSKLEDLLKFLIPNYIIEGKNQLVIAIGCTGGKHRSVTLTNAIYEKLEKMEYGCKKEHRDIVKA